ncbi:winged helix-turn-helix domain-containing protein [Cryptosporangium phraense]|uniref:Helix-turn-helix transcriptional regulator n=1 Tax=Cryptosporangium phraense TaxID=2593070 RepID=A0A545B027_9ACTN|nr:helix-turn-helix domain-containing protein [Cryptosporangium phraense]TQS46943.1 helix-turn-helix transcriptional regulator [Cryptosporangium phraense]
MELTDPTAIRALSHPLRLDLLDLLATRGSMTAATAGRILGVPQANCSFHLRQLAKYGFVEDAGPGDDKRARQWRLPDPRPTIRVESNPAVQQELETLVIEREANAALDYARRTDPEAVDWRRHAGPVSAIAVVTPEEAAELRRQWLELLEPYLNRRAPGRPTRFFLSATPMKGDDDDRL